MARIVSDDQKVQTENELKKKEAELILQSLQKEDYLVLLDENEPFVVDAEKLHSRARNTAFEGRKFQGRAKATGSQAILAPLRTLDGWLRAAARARLS